MIFNSINLFNIIFNPLNQLASRKVSQDHEIHHDRESKPGACIFQAVRKAEPTNPEEEVSLPFKC